MRYHAPTPYATIWLTLCDGGPIGEPSANVRKQCYEAFKSATKPDTREILESYEKLLITKAGMRQTSRDRKAEFKKATGKLRDLVSVCCTW